MRPDNRGIRLETLEPEEHRQRSWPSDCSVMKLAHEGNFDQFDRCSVIRTACTSSEVPTPDTDEFGCRPGSTAPIGLTDLTVHIDNYTRHIVAQICTGRMAGAL